MEIAKIVLDYLRVLTWPVAALVLVYLLRERLAGLLGRITSISTPAGDLEFAADVNQLHDAAVGAAVNGEDTRQGLGVSIPATGGIQPLGAFEALRDVATSAPEAAIMAAWRRVELRLSEVNSRLEGNPPGREHATRMFPITPRRWTERLVSAGLDPDVAEIIAELVTLRNRAAHSTDISGISAAEYVESCAVVWALLDRFMETRGNAETSARD